MQSVHITSNAVNLESHPGEVYSKQHYVMQFDSDLRQVGEFFMYSGFLHQ